MCQYLPHAVYVLSDIVVVYPHSYNGPFGLFSCVYSDTQMYTALCLRTGVFLQRTHDGAGTSRDTQLTYAFGDTVVTRNVTTHYTRHCGWPSVAMNTKVISPGMLPTYRRQPRMTFPSSAVRAAARRRVPFSPQHLHCLR